MIEYTWNIVQMDAYPQYAGTTDVVFNVHWTMTGTDGTYTGYVYGSVGITHDADEPFVPYAQLTEEQVVGWVKAALGEEQVLQYEANVLQQIEDKKNPKVITPELPW